MKQNQSDHGAPFERKRKPKQSKRETPVNQCQPHSLTGFFLMAPPTARTALGFPAISARRLYETVSPNFTSLRSTCSTRLVNVSSPHTQGGGGKREHREREEGSSFNHSNTAGWLTGWLTEALQKNQPRWAIQHNQDFCCSLYMPVFYN